jgi:hypothetical protein
MVRGLLFLLVVTSNVTEGTGRTMRTGWQLQLSVEPVRPSHRSLRRCYGCGNYERPFVEMDGVIRCERCAKKDRESEREGEKDLQGIESYGLIT